MTNIQISQFRAEVRRLFPGIDERALRSIVDREARHAENKHLGPLSYAPLAIAAVAGYIRHHLTHYDTLLTDGRHTRFLAREAVRPVVQRIEADWGRV